MKLFERLILKDLDAHSGILHLKNAVEHHGSVGKYTLVAFLDVKRAYVRDGAFIPVASLHAMGIIGRLILAFRVCLEGRSITVMLGITLSSPRLIHTGLVQGNVLSIFFV